MKTPLAALLALSLTLLAGCGGSAAPPVSTPLMQLVSTSTALTASPNPSSAGTPVVLTATVTATSGTPSGSITFLDGTSSLGTSNISATGSATLSVSTFAAASTHTLTAAFSASGSFAPSTSPAVTLTVSPAPAPAAIATTSTLTASPNPAAAGAPVTLSATVTASSGTPSGTLVFMDGTSSLGSATLGATGAATLTVSTFAASSTHTLTAVYSGTAAFLASTSPAVTLTVAAAAPSAAATVTTLTASPNPAPASTAVTLTATVTAPATGTVTFLDAATSLGTATLTNSTATLSVSTFAPSSSHTLTAMYAGTPGFAASTSTPVSLTIGAAINITAHGTFTFTSPNQTIAGFGGAEAFYASYLDSHPYESEINTALFDPAQGLGLQFLRVQNSYYNFSGSNSTTFDPDTPKIVSAANAAHGTPLTLLMSAWTPPASLKSNASVNGCTGTTNGNCTSGFGTLVQVNGAYNYAGYAQFWADSLNAYAALGVKPDLISIQNEPDFPASYVGCVFNPTEAPVTTYGQTTTYAGYGKAFDAVYQKLSTLTALPVPKMIGPENFSTSNAPSFAASIPAGEAYAVAHHMYNVGSGGNPNNAGGYTSGGNPDSGLTAESALQAAYPNTLKFETEYYQTPGFYNAWDIHNALAVTGDSAYFYWALAWPSTLSNGVSVDQAGLIQLDNPYAPSTWVFPHGWTFNDSYYALKHFSFFIRPGYTRFNATVDNTDERLSVYQSPDKKTTVIVALNVSATVTDGLSLNLTGIPYTASTVYRSSFQTPLTTGERYSNLGAYPAAGLSLPPQSVVTIVLTN